MYLSSLDLHSVICYGESQFKREILCHFPNQLALMRTVPSFRNIAFGLESEIFEYTGVGAGLGDTQARPLTVLTRSRASAEKGFAHSDKAPAEPAALAFSACGSHHTESCAGNAGRRDLGFVGNSVDSRQLGLARTDAFSSFLAAFQRFRVCYLCPMVRKQNPVNPVETLWIGQE